MDKYDFEEYYENQVGKIKKNEYPMGIQLDDGNGTKTKRMSINKESAKVLIEFLENFLKEEV